MNIKDIVPGNASQKFIAADQNGRSNAFERTALAYDNSVESAQRTSSEKQYGILFQDNPQPMWIFDSETLAFLDVNDAAIQHYGYSRDEFLDMTIRDIRPGQDVPALFTQQANCTRGYGRYDPSVKWKHRTKDGSLIDVEITWHTFDFAGRPAKLVLAHDVTGRAKAEAESARLFAENEDQRRRLNEILSSIPSMVWESTFNPAGGIPIATFVNSYVEQMFGYTVEEWLSTPSFWFSTLHSDDRRLISDGSPELLEKGRSRNELRWIAKDGRVVWTENQIVLVKEETGAAVGVRGVSTDITERKRMEEERQAISDRKSVV